MFCSKCGSPLGAGERFCKACGADNAVGIPQQPVAPQPVAPQPVACSKREYFKNVAPANVKTKVNLSRIFGIVCLAVMLLSYFVVMNTSVQNIPCIATILGPAADNIESSMKDMEDYAEMMEEALEEQEDHFEEILSSSEMKELENFIKCTQKCGQSFSIQNCKNLMKSYEKLTDIDDGMLDRYLGDMDEIKAVIIVFDGITTFLLIGALLCAAFMFFGGMFHMTPLVGVGFGFSCVYALLFCGWLILALIVLVSVLLLVCTVGANKGYKEYRKNPVIAY